MFLRQREPEGPAGSERMGAGLSTTLRRLRRPRSAGPVEQERDPSRRVVHLWDWRRGERIEGEGTFTSIVSGTLNVDALADRMLRGDIANVYGHWLDLSVFVMVDDSVVVLFGTHRVRIQQ